MGLLALASLFIYNHGLEETLPFILYTIAAVTIPLGLMLCILGVIFNRVRRSAQNHDHPGGPGFNRETKGPSR
jgi:hypothetical protein